MFGIQSKRNKTDQQIAELRQRIDEVERLCEATCDEIQDKYGAAILATILRSHLINSRVPRSRQVNS
ncbi:MAG: hypothetical protein RIE73_25200 [Coleofasciculus sp. C1-SOL-03]|jgi:hypothetical protein|uniref:hypothetical protein n=1 Tax=Coleofasciculus sp. C1-SOL-03 TaxID=3069522 RepID=UPI0032FDE44C